MSNTTKDSEAKLQSLPPSAVAFLRSGRQPWMGTASCAGMDPEIFQRPDEVEDASVWPAAAKQHCAGCCVREHCLEYAMKHRDLTGVWGGTTDEERARISSRARRIVSL